MIRQGPAASVGAVERLGSQAALLLFALLLSGACRSGGPAEEHLADPRVILAARLSHGLGADPLDSPLLADSVNAALLVAARDGLDSAGFAAGWRGAGGWPRLATLVTEGLLLREGRGWRPASPIVVGRDRQRYDSITRAVAGAALGEHEERLRALLREIDRRGWRLWQYHFIWSQVFDAQRVWAMVARSSVTSPLSPAISWVIYPPHPYQSGTNLYPGRLDSPEFLLVTWTPRAKAQLGPLETAAEPLLRALHGRPEDPAGSRQALIALGLLTRTGEPAIPVLHRGEPLMMEIEALATSWGATLLRRIDAASIAGVVHTSPRTAWAMAYHDVSWSALQLLVERGMVEPFPPLGGAAADPASPPARGRAAIVPADSEFVAALLKASTSDK